MKKNKVLLDESEEDKIHMFMKAQSDQNNFLILFNLSILFKLSSLCKDLKSYIECCFPMASDSNNFLDLDFVSLKKILSSSGLNIDSELEIFDAADSWLRYDMFERGKYAKYLLSKVRLSLLSVPALNQILTKLSSFSVDKDCTNVIKKALTDNKDLISTTCITTSRYCNKNSFNFLVCGGFNNTKQASINDVISINVKNIGKVKRLPQMIKARQSFKAVYIKGELYVFGGIYQYREKSFDQYITKLENVNTVEKYSPANNEWEHVCDMYDGRESFMSCSFMSSVYVVGGFKDKCSMSTCVQFRTSSVSWKELSRMNEERCYAACSVFKGRIVVSGGFSFNAFESKTVEVYDHVANEWLKMASMIEGRLQHSSVVVNDKLYIIGGNGSKTLEAFDPRSSKFSLLKEPIPGITRNYVTREEVFTVDSKLLIIGNKGKVIFYDFKNNECLETECEATKYLAKFSCVNLPVIAFETNAVTIQ